MPEFCYDVLSAADIITCVESQVLKYGNIKDYCGCVYGVECEDAETKIMAQYVLDRYAEKQLRGWFYFFNRKTCGHINNRKKTAYKRWYTERQQIKISVKDLDEHYIEIKKRC